MFLVVERGREQGKRFRVDRPMIWAFMKKASDFWEVTV